MMLSPTITPTTCPICEEEIAPDDKRWYSLEAMGEVHFDCRDGDLPLVIDEKSLKPVEWHERSMVKAECPHCRNASEDWLEEDNEVQALQWIATRIDRRLKSNKKGSVWQCDKCKQLFSSRY